MHHLSLPRWTAPAPGTSHQAMRITGKSLLVTSILALSLSACGDTAERAENDTREAEGEVLEGSISDEMIPLDQLRSEGDMEEPEAAEGEAGAAPAADEPAAQAEPDAAVPGEG